MKVKGLIKALKKVNPELNVVIKGYEGGVDDMRSMKGITIERDVNTAWYYGDHEQVEDSEVEDNKLEVNALLLE